MLERLKEQPKEVAVYNPSNEDFTTTYDINEDRNPVAYIAKAQEITFFSPIIAEHIKKHLANKLIQERGIKTNFQDEYDNLIKDELSVQI